LTHASKGVEGDAAEQRCRQRLREVLGLDETAVEVVMNLRRQVVSLQNRVYELETSLDMVQTEKGHRMSRFRQTTYEAVWEDAGDLPAGHEE
jgi:hypothetical protein